MSRVAQVPSTSRERSDADRVGRTSPPRRNSNDNHYGIVAVCFPTLAG
jgi:hypothetical protein